MNQHEFVNWAKKQHQFEDETFEKAHYPIPERKGGTETIRLHHYDHAIQGIFQSKEFDCRCFHNGNSWKALYRTPGFCPGWFEACDLFQKYANEVFSQLSEQRTH